MENTVANKNTDQETSKLPEKYQKRAKKVGTFLYITGAILALILLLGVINMIGSQKYDSSDIAMCIFIFILDILFFILGYMFQKKPEKIMHPENALNPVDIKKFNSINNTVIEEINKLYNVDAPHINLDTHVITGNIKKIIIYDCNSYWHLITIGMTRLCDARGEPKIEYTFKLKKNNLEDDKTEIFNIGQKLLGITSGLYNGAKLIRENQSLVSRQASGINADSNSIITGFITIPDATLRPITTQDGTVQFIELIGATDAELKSLEQSQLSVEELYEKIGTDITNYDRKSVV